MMTIFMLWNYFFMIIQCYAFFAIKIFFMMYTIHIHYTYNIVFYHKIISLGNDT